MATQPDSSLAHVRAVVTGSTRGLGAAFVAELASRGAGVILNGRDEQQCSRGERAHRESGRRVVAVPGSVADEEVAQRLVDTCVAEFGGIDLVVNNAGLIRDRTLVRMSEDDFDEVIAVHLRGTWAVTRAAARVMRGSGGGSIVNVVSGSALFGLIGQCNYAAAKGGIIALTRALSVELARYQIRVNALYPAALTAMTESVLAISDTRDSGLPEIPPFEPPELVAPVIGLFASPAGQSLTGQVISFDGRDLTVWSHPAPVSSWSRTAPWTGADVETAFRDGHVRPQPLNPDQLGAAVRARLAG